jgi:hypothetical protein
VIHYLCNVDPFNAAKRFIDRNLQTLELALFNFLFLFILQFVTNRNGCFLTIRKSLSQRVVSVNNPLLVILIFLFGLREEHLALEGREGVGEEQVLGLELLDLGVLGDGDHAG